MRQKPKYTLDQLIAETELPLALDRAWLDVPDVGHEIFDAVERAADFARRSNMAEIAAVIRATANLIDATTCTDPAAHARASKALKEVERAVRAVGDRSATPQHRQ